MVNMLASIGLKTKQVPSIAALMGSIPSRFKRATFSATTIASSTTIPITIITPERVVLFMVMPVSFINIIEEQKVKGIPAATHNPEVKSRKIISNDIIMTNPIKPFIPIKERRLRTSVDSSSNRTTFTFVFCRRIFS